MIYGMGCIASAKLQILKAIHNCTCNRCSLWFVVLRVQSYKFWKQFTTHLAGCCAMRWLYCECKVTNFESNSQQFNQFWNMSLCCIASAKLQILKAIHNRCLRLYHKSRVVLRVQSYKFWKQFTTRWCPFHCSRLLYCECKVTNFESNSQRTPLRFPHGRCCIASAKLQILKAIHNRYAILEFAVFVVLRVQSYKFWKQFTTHLAGCCAMRWLYCECKVTNFESNSQLASLASLYVSSCIASAKLQILKAIHNNSRKQAVMGSVVLRVQSYKFWKQFTTVTFVVVMCTPLYCECKVTNFESNSQLTPKEFRRLAGCIASAKLQILKAIHNFHIHRLIPWRVVLRVQSYKFWKQFTTESLNGCFRHALYCECKVTNFESNSQQLFAFCFMHSCCIASAKLQILKAIHNQFTWLITVTKVVLRVQSYKFWKQFTTLHDVENICYLLYCECKVTNFESNSQHIHTCTYYFAGCIASAKLQILKAIHNTESVITAFYLLYCECKVTNFESNSQLPCTNNRSVSCCIASAKLQILKAIHNKSTEYNRETEVVLRVQSYKFWKQFTTYSRYFPVVVSLYCECKVTNFESNSQQLFLCVRQAFVVLRVQSYKFWKQFTT